MKHLFVILALLIAGCAPVHFSSVTPPGVVTTMPVTVEPVEIIINTWINSQPSAIPVLDLSHLSLNEQQSASSVFECPIPPGGDASGPDSPQGILQVTKGNIHISGSAISGMIQFGKQPHDNTQTGACYIVGEEAYTYNVRGDSLVLCSPKYVFCWTFNRY